MKKRFIGITALALIILAGGTQETVLAKSHHHSEAVEAVQISDCYEDGYCIENGSCDIDGICQNGGVCSGVTVCYKDGSCDVDGVCQNGTDCDGTIHQTIRHNNRSNHFGHHGRGYRH